MVRVGRVALARGGACHEAAVAEEDQLGRAKCGSGARSDLVMARVRVRDTVRLTVRVNF